MNIKYRKSSRRSVAVQGILLVSSPCQFLRQLPHFTIGIFCVKYIVALFIVFRKRFEQEFRVPMQGYYAGSLSGAGRKAWEVAR